MFFVLRFSVTIFALFALYFSQGGSITNDAPPFSLQAIVQAIMAVDKVPYFDAVDQLSQDGLLPSELEEVHCQMLHQPNENNQQVLLHDDKDLVIPDSAEESETSTVYDILKIKRKEKHRTVKICRLKSKHKRHYDKLLACPLCSKLLKHRIVDANTLLVLLILTNSDIPCLTAHRNVHLTIPTIPTISKA